MSHLSSCTELQMCFERSLKTQLLKVENTHSLAEENLCRPSRAKINLLVKCKDNIFQA